MDPVAEAYRRAAATYIDLFGASAQVRADDLALVTECLSVSPGTVLDAGCGPGHLTAHLRSKGADAIGIDLVPEFIAHAQATNPDVPYALGSLHDLPLPTGSVAGILAWYSLIHLPPHDLDRVLGELRRVAVPRATLVVGFFDGAEVAPFAHKVVTAHFWPIDELSRRLRRAGFDEVERVRRPATGGSRAHAAIVAVAAR